MTNDVRGFRQALHEWAIRQLEQKSDHVGPFEIERVHLEDHWDTWHNDPVTVSIQFRHDGTDCPDRNKMFYTGLGPIVHPACLMRTWATSTTDGTIAVLNELFAIADTRSVR